MSLGLLYLDFTGGRRGERDVAGGKPRKAGVSRQQAISAGCVCAMPAPKPVTGCQEPGLCRCHSPLLPQLNY